MPTTMNRIVRGDTQLPSRPPKNPPTVAPAAITARLARGEDVAKAVEGAKAFVHRAIGSNPGLGGGFGPINIFADPRLDSCHVG